jgi:hypothetical protein
MIHTLSISSEELNFLLHDLTKIAHCLACIDTTEESKRLLHSCEMELARIRQAIIESVEDTN